jgi:23S rRNA (cytosine1962-C5)-methyltransferase
MRWTDLAYIAELTANQTDVCGVASWDSGKIERFGSNILISHSSEEIRPGILDQLDVWIQESGLVIDRIYVKRLVVGPGKDDAPALIRGTAEGETISLVKESGLTFEVDFQGGYSCGLFLDQRANRLRLREYKPARVLNTFAYTCSFSVAAAAAGAQTVSLDLAKVALERGRRNFTHNGLSLDGHRFIADDVLDVFPRLVRRGEKFDAIVLDPPTFSRGRSGRPFRVERDLPVLIDLAVQCASPGASILLSTNCSTIGVTELHHMGEGVVSDAKFSPSHTLPDIARHGAATLWMKLPR